MAVHRDETVIKVGMKIDRKGRHILLEIERFCQLVNSSLLIAVRTQQMHTNDNKRTKVNSLS